MNWGTNSQAGRSSPLCVRQTSLSYSSTAFKTLYYDRVLQKLKEAMGIDFGKTVYTRAEIRSMVAKSKKTS
jgi:hypothetical protein